MHAVPGVRALPFTRRTLPPAGGQRRSSSCTSGLAHRYDPPPMTRRCAALATAALLALPLVASGCNGDDDEKKAAESTTTTGKRGKPPPPPKEREEAQREAAEARQQERELKDLDKDDEEIDKSFDSPFERAILKLPIRKPPLYVQQYITGEGHKVYTAVDEKRFCKMSPAKREAAVTSFYKAADRGVRRAGVKDFVQVVTPLASTAEELPALATGRAGKVSFSRRGRSC